MDKFFTISQTAEIVGMTTETLRHYDRIGLVKPCKTDEWTKYRYYSQGEIVRLNTIRALRVMDLSLDEIKNVLEYDDLSKIIDLLKHAEQSADNKITELNFAKTKIINARTFYENKSAGKNENVGGVIKILPERAILLSEELQAPSLENLWDYHRNFYKLLNAEDREKFTFEDLAGIYEENGRANLFAVCTRHIDIKGIKYLPKGKYLCVDCTDDTRKSVTAEAIETVKREYGRSPDFVVHLIVLTGILQWKYQTQIFIEHAG